jgi:hypothetical protein
MSDNTEDYIVIDPPQGHRYGFPKAVTMEEYKSQDFNIIDWLIKGGYPKTEVTFAARHLRMWRQNEEI